MAVNLRRITTIQRARLRRLNLRQYLPSGAWWATAGMAVVTALMAFLLLMQTTSVATRGYEAASLRAEQTALLREHGQLQARKAEAQNLVRIRERAQELGLRPFSKEQVRYLIVSPDNSTVTPVQFGPPGE